MLHNLRIALLCVTCSLCCNFFALHLSCLHLISFIFLHCIFPFCIFICCILPCCIFPHCIVLLFWRQYNAKISISGGVAVAVVVAQLAHVQLCWSLEACIHLQKAFQPSYIVTFFSKFNCIVCLVVESTIEAPETSLPTLIT